MKFLPATFTLAIILAGPVMALALSAPTDPVISREDLLEDARQLTEILESSHPDPYLGGGGEVAYYRRLHILLQSIPRDGLTRSRFCRLLQPFVAALQDDNTRIFPPMENSGPAPGGLPFLFRTVENKLVVEGVFDARYESLIGSILISVEGVEVSEIIRRGRQLYGVEDQYRLLALLGGTGTLWRDQELERLIPEWRDRSRVTLTLRSPEGRLSGYQIPVPPTITAPPITTRPVLALPPADKTGAGYGFLDGGKQTAILVIHHLGMFREQFEFSGSSDHPGARAGARRYYSQYHGTPPPASLDEVIAGLPSAAELFLSLLKEMKENACRQLIIDLREYSGDSPVTADILLQLLYGREKLLVIRSSWAEIRRYSPLYFQQHPDEHPRVAGAAGPVISSGGYDFSMDSALPARAGSQTARSRRSLTEMTAAAAFQETVRPGAHGPPPRVAVLCSPGTYSSASALLRDLQSAGAAIIVSSPVPAGDRYGSPLEFTLKHSGLRGSVSSAYFQEKPDSLSATGRAPVPFVLPYKKYAAYGFAPDAEVRYALEILSRPDRQPVSISARQLLDNFTSKTFTGEPVELNFANASLAEILARFETIGGLKFKPGPGISTRRPLPNRYRFSGQAWDKALDTVLSDNGLELRLEGDELIVDRFTAKGDRSTFAFFIGLTTAVAGTGGIVLAVVLRRRRRRKMERDRRISLEPSLVDEIVQRLNYLFQIDKIHRNGRLTLDSLSERLGLQPYQLSGIINSRMGKTFTSLVADYRVEEVKRRLADPRETATILNIAFDAGFGTKASFNRIFKERTRMTPREFKKAHLPAK